MLNRLKSLLRASEEKTSRTARLIALESGGRPRWTPRDYAALAREGYARNAIVYRAVRLIAENIGALSFVLYEGCGRARQPSAAQSHEATEPASGLRIAPRSDCLASPVGRQRLYRGRRPWRGEPDAGPRTLRAAARPHKTFAGPGRLAAGLRIFGGRVDGALRSECHAAADTPPYAVQSAR